MLTKRLATTGVSILISCLFSASAFAGGWDENKGLQQLSLKGELVCIGCSLKKLDGANAQCSLYAQHAIGFKTADGTLWSIVDNAKGHDIINAHKLLGHKTATINGWIFPLAHFIEIDTVHVEGAGQDEIAKVAREQDRQIAKGLLERK